MDSNESEENDEGSKQKRYNSLHVMNHNFTNLRKCESQRNHSEDPKYYYMSNANSDEDTINLEEVKTPTSR